MGDLPDPRTFPEAQAAAPEAGRLYRLAVESLAAPTGRESDLHDAAIEAAIAALLRQPDGAPLTALLDGAPSVAIYRHLWRLVAQQASGGREGDDSLVTLFAIPLVIVASAVAGNADAPVLLSGVLPDVDALVTVLREHAALARNQTFTLANALIAAETLEVANLPMLLAASRHCGEKNAFVPLTLPTAAIEVCAREGAHLRFLVGSAIAAAGGKVLRDQTVGRWGMPLARALIAQLGAPGVSLVALPRAAASLPAAVAQGRSARREVAAQLFVSNALRELRASFGEPVAVISAHLAADAPGGGELRLSLSSPLSPKDAQGFRCPLFPGDRVADVASMLVDLLRDCRVQDVRSLSGVHGDRELVTGGPLLFKPDTIPANAKLRVH